MRRGPTGPRFTSAFGGIVPAVSLLDGIAEGLTGGTVKSLPIDRLGGLFQASTVVNTGRGIETLGGIYQSYGALYRTQPWVHIVVNKLARGVARLPLRTIEFTGDRRERSVLYDHPFHDLVLNPWPGGSSFALKEAMVGSLALHGHALIAKYRPRRGQPPSELWPLKWQFVTPKAGEDRPIGLYEYRGPEGRANFLPEDVIHLTWWGPEGVGVSPLEPLRRTLMLEEGAQRYSINSFRNAARPSGALSTDQKMNRTERQELREEIEAAHAGVDQAFRLALLSGGLKWEPFSHTAVEAEVINLRKLTREEVAAAYDIPPPVIHILDRATFSNIDEQHRMWYQDTLAPILEMVAETLLVQAFRTEPSYGDNAFPEFDLSDVLKADPDKHSSQQQRRFQSGESTPNELRAENRKPPIGDPDDPTNPANQVYIPVNMTPVSAISTEPAPEPEPPDPDAPPVPPTPDPGTEEIIRRLVMLEATLMEMGKSNGNGHHPMIHVTNPAMVHVGEDEAEKRMAALFEQEAVRLRKQIEEGQQGEVVGRAFEYDDSGKAVKVLETLADGSVRAYAVERDNEGRLVTLTREEQ